MQWKALRQCAAAALVALPATSALRQLSSTSLDQCDGSTSSGFTANLFNVIFTPDNGTLQYNINAISSISQKVIAELNVIAYGIVAVNKTIDPCTDAGFSTLCPLNPGTIPLNSVSQLPQNVVNQVPGIAYTVPDIDAKVRVYLFDRDTHAQVACVEAQLSNGQTVDQTGVKWTTAVIAGLGLLASAVTSGLGHSNTAAHVASNALSLFGFFQAQAIVGMTAVEMPPIVTSWTQDFQWTMGIINIGFMQNILTWYQRATGGTPTTLLSNLSVQSVAVERRSLEYLQAAGRLISRGYAHVLRRQSNSAATNAASGSQQQVVRGITRVGFRAGIEQSNIFLTGLAFFIAFIVAVSLLIALCKGVLELAAKQGWMKSDKFQDFRNGWRIVLKGILFRIVLIGYTQICILCLWELTVRDSAAEVVLALFYFVAMTAALFWAAFKVLRLAKRSVSIHKNPAYILYSDPTALNKWGFLYVSFRASAYYFIFPQLGYILFKAVFVAFAQGAPVVQALGLLIVEGLWLIGVSILRPWMDKKTNTFNISISAINFLNAIFLLIFSNIFNQPGLVSGIVGVVFALVNAVFALVLLLMVLVASLIAIFSKNPETRYMPMRDDRGSFIKSQTNLNTELDALGATARGDMKMRRDLDDDDEGNLTPGGDSGSLSSGHHSRLHNPAGMPLPPSNNGSTRNVDQYGQPARYGSPQPYANRPNTAGAPAPYAQRNGSGGQSGYSYDRSQSLQSNRGYRPPPMAGPNSNPWQRGAGYDH